MLISSLRGTKNINFRPTQKLQIELLSAIYGKREIQNTRWSVRKVIQKQLDDFQYDFAMTNKLAGKDPAGGTSEGS